MFSRSRPRFALVAAAAACVALVGVDWYRAAPPGALAGATHVGRESCAACHEQEHRAWAGSHHDQAMQLATEATVLADFDDTTFERFGVETRFFRDGDRFMVHTEGPDGEMADFEVKYTFGVEPLQQYMVELPRGDGAGGRVQVLRISWDTRRREWFDATPPDVTDERILPGDPLHWTGVTQNWNTSCAICHSTNLQKNFDLATNTYHTTYSEIDVSCEACHGPGSLHVELASDWSLFWDRRHGYGLAELKNPDPSLQIESCAKCHMRHDAPIHPEFRPGTPLLDSFEPALLRTGLYHADGQIQDEVYVYGSFVQSKMHAKGVRCTDCHDPHTLKPKFEGNRLCAQCHEPAKYDTAVHHYHPDPSPGVASVGAQCVECHMPAEHYMVVDARRDHSFRVPRPDLTVAVGTPNACNRCHRAAGESAEWAAAKVVEWFGDTRAGTPPWAPALAAGRAGAPDGEPLLIQLARTGSAPEIVRATAVELLNRYPGPAAAGAVDDALDSPSPLIRLAAVRSASAETAEALLDKLSPLLEDSTRAVRMAAARKLSPVANQPAVLAQPEALGAAVEELRENLLVQNDRQAAHQELAALAAAAGDRRTAADELRTAISLEPYWSGPRRELANLLEAMGGDLGEIEQLRREEIERLERDAEFLPRDGRVRYLLGMTNYQAGRLAEAEDALAEAVRREPESYEFLMALALLQEQRFVATKELKHLEATARTLERLHTLDPDDPRAASILRRVIARQQAGGRGHQQ